MGNPIFEVGKPIPKVWLHCEFNHADTCKYVGGVVIQDDKELNRLVDKYLSGKNSEEILIQSDRS